MGSEKLDLNLCIIYNYVLERLIISRGKNCRMYVCMY